MATDQGSLSFAFIQSEIAKGEDVEIDIRYRNGGRHYVEVTGAGTILGVPWITHVADQHQDNNAAGTDSVQFDFVLNGDQRPMEGNGAIIDQVISESLNCRSRARWFCSAPGLRRRPRRNDAARVRGVAIAEAALCG
jgi:hypothetical protein